MASHVASADDADALALRNKAVTEFASVIATLDGIELDQSEADALKKMKRGAALRGVMAAKGCDKPETLETMAREWVGGMLVATYALEKAASSRRFVQKGDRELVTTLNKCYDATSTWAETHLVKALGLAKKVGGDDEQRPSCEARPDPVPEAEARRLVNEALRRGTAQFEDYAGDDPAPAALALQTDTWPRGGGRPRLLARRDRQGVRARLLRGLAGLRRAARRSHGRRPARERLPPARAAGRRHEQNKTPGAAGAEGGLGLRDGLGAHRSRARVRREAGGARGAAAGDVFPKGELAELDARVEPRGARDAARASQLPRRLPRAAARPSACR